MSGLLGRALDYFRANGLSSLPRKVGASLHARFLLPLIPDPVSRRRHALERRLFQQCGGIVLAGPLKGLKMHPAPGWGGNAPKLLGTYEAPILDKLIELSASADTLIDIGAADGFYGVGLVSQGFYKRSVCFEISSVSQRVLAEVAELNGVAGRVRILGAAGSDLAEVVSREGLPLTKSVVLCDIEGAEFDVFTPDLLHSLRRCPIIVELHEAYVENSQQRLTSLLEAAGEHFQASFMGMGERSISDHPIVASLSETDRWLLVSESRKINQRWLILQPR